MPDVIFHQKDIAKVLGVTPGAVGNWRTRKKGWPEPRYISTSGVMYWDEEGLKKWKAWWYKWKVLDGL